MKPIKDKRFFITQQNTGFTMNQYVLVDKQTGVNYLYVASGYSGGLAALLDTQGNPIVTPIVDED